MSRAPAGGGSGGGVLPSSPHQSPLSPRLRRPPRVLLLTASPPDWAPVFGHELKDVVQKAIDDYHFDHNHNADQPPLIELECNLRCQIKEVQPALVRNEPDIVHVHAHMGKDGVVLVDERTVTETQKHYDMLTNELLTKIMTAQTIGSNQPVNQIKVVLLTGCNSLNMAKSLRVAARVPVVIYTTQLVHPDVVQVFCAAWYEAVFAGYHVLRAAAVAENQLQAEHHENVFEQDAAEDLVLLPSLPLEARPPRPQPVYFNVPRRDIKYIERPTVWRKLRRALMELGERRFVILYGLGGVGKSELALEYISSLPTGNDKYRWIAWFRAEDTSQLVSDYIDFAEEMKMPLRDKPEKVVVREVTNWLEKKGFWLLVYDNATSWEAIVDYLPQWTKSRTQHVIVTSRHQAWPNTCLQVDVKEMEACESFKLVQTVGKIKNHDGSHKNIIALAKHLGHLPLALSQAAAYIATHNVPVGEYLKDYERLLVQKTGALMPAMPVGDRHVIVALTWDITMKALRTKIPVAGIVLAVCGYLAPDAIPRALLERWFQLAYPGRPNWKDVLRDVLAALRVYSLIYPVDDDGEVFKIHRVLQLVVRHQHERVDVEHKTVGFLRALCCCGRLWMRMTDHSSLQAKDSSFSSIVMDSWCDTMVDAVLGEYGSSEERLWRSRPVKLLPHMRALTDRFDRSLSSTIKSSWNKSTARSRLLESHAYILQHQLRDYKAAVVVLKQLLTLVEDQNEGDHHKALSRLCVAYGSSGDQRMLKAELDRAADVVNAFYSDHHVEELMRAIRDPRRSKKDHEYVYVAITIHNVGFAYYQLGEWSKAKDLLERCLTFQECLFGENAVALAGTLRPLGDVYGELGYDAKQRGDVSGASQHHDKQIELLKRALALQIPEPPKSYGKDHVETALTRHSLGVAHQSLGEYDTAKELVEQALDVLRKTYGNDHIDIAKPLYSLGQVHGALHNYQEQVKRLEEALEIQRDFYDSDHIDVAITMHSLADAYGAHGALDNCVQRKELLEKALVVLRGWYRSDEHIKVASVLRSLASLPETPKLELSSVAHRTEEDKEAEVTFGRRDTGMARRLKKAEGLRM